MVDFFSGLSPVAAFEGFVNIIGNVFTRLFDTLKSTFASSYNWIVERLNKIPGVSIDLKTAPVPAGNAPQLDGGQLLLAGNTVGGGITSEGLRQSVTRESKTTIDQRRSIGNVHFVMPNGMTPAQLAEWQEMQ